MNDSLKALALLGTSNIAKKDRAEQDYYATDPKAVHDLLENEILSKHIIEPSVGGGHIAHTLQNAGHTVTGLDITHRGFEGTIVQDWLSYGKPICCDIVMNPPYSAAQAHIEHGLDLLQEGNKLCAFLKIQFLESQARKSLFDKYKPARIYVYGTRMCCAYRGDFSEIKHSNAMLFCWFVWEKGNHTKPPQVYWIYHDKGRGKNDSRGFKENKNS